MSLFKVFLLILPLTVFLSPSVEGWIKSTILVNSILVDSTVLERRSSIFVTMSNGTESILSLINSRDIQSDTEKSFEIMRALEAHSESTQAPVANVLNRIGVVFKRFWISNQIYIKNGSPSAVLALLNSLPQDGSIISEIREEIFSPVPRTFNVSEGTKTQDVQWGVSQIRAPEAWESSGVRGKGVIVGVIDTGCRSTHVDLQGKLEEGGWLDPLTKSMVPYDDSGHGTHVTGTLVGQNGIGVAPDATYVACKACDRNACYESGLTECAQFMISKNVHVVNNAWDGKNFHRTLDTLSQAGIVSVFSVGDQGPDCNSTRFRGESSKEIRVGAVDINRKIASVSCCQTEFSNPEVTAVAPGFDISSTSNTNDKTYKMMSGNSLASPHVSGLIALMLSKDRTLSYDAILQNLKMTSNRMITFDDAQCGGKLDDESPNFIFGYGEIDCVSALNRIAVGMK